MKCCRTTRMIRFKSLIFVGEVRKALQRADNPAPVRVILREHPTRLASGVEVAVMDIQRWYPHCTTRGVRSLLS